MRKNIYLPTQFEKIVAENDVNMSELSQRAILEADPYGKYLVLMQTVGTETHVASDVILADTKQMEALNDHLWKNKYAESYSWFPFDTLEQAKEKWQIEASKLGTKYGIIGDLRGFDVSPVAFINVRKE